MFVVPPTDKRASLLGKIVRKIAAIALAPRGHNTHSFTVKRGGFAFQVVQSKKEDRFGGYL